MRIDEFLKKLLPLPGLLPELPGKGEYPIFEDDIPEEFLISSEEVKEGIEEFAGSEKTPEEEEKYRRIR